MKYLFISGLILLAYGTTGQSIKDKLSSAINNLEKDIQFKHAILSMYVMDSKTGKTVFEKNAALGMAPASCQKIITSVTAMDLLGKDFQFKTYIGTDPASTAKSNYPGCLFIIAGGDPTLGSWRWKSTVDTVVLGKITAALKKRSLYTFEDNLVIEDNLYGITPLPEGWIWQDIGNYYGAPCFGLNWHENQFDMILQPGTYKGAPAPIIQTKPVLPDIVFSNSITTGAGGSGDNGYIYSVPYSSFIFSKGTVPLQKEPFTISGSLPNPADVLKNELMAYLVKHNITIKGNAYSANVAMINSTPVHKAMRIIDSIASPPLDSVNYWFLKKSVNLYGEAFLKALVKNHLGFGIGDGTYDRALGIVKQFWKDKGVEPGALNILDGSGLSPANRVTTQALVTIMQYAKKQSWFPSFYNALPEMNDIKMKDGYIGGVRSYTGYSKSKDGNEYTFSFIVNNFDGSAGTVREKMWKLLNLLK